MRSVVPSDAPTALVIDGGNPRSALVATRALGRAGWRVVLGSRGGASYAGRSRWCAHNVPLRSIAVEGSPAFLDDVALLLQTERIDVLVPCGDAEVLALSAARDRLSAVVPFAPHAVVEQVFDKLWLAKAGARVGLLSPRTERAEQADVDSFSLPVILKPRTRAGDEGRPRSETAVLADHDSARRVIAEMLSRGEDPLIQEPVADAVLVSVIVLTDRQGTVVAQLQQEAERLWPLPAGNPSRARVIPLDPDLATALARLLGALPWWGVVQVEFLRDPSGRHFLVDFNGRVFGSMPLADVAGTGMLDRWLREAIGRAVPPHAPPARVGLRYQNRADDLRRALRERRGSRLRDIADTLTCRPDSYLVWDRSDPRPWWHAARTAQQRR